jgi:hypothetical protein
MSEIVFLDTTIQIRRNYGSLEEIARIREQLRGRRVITSTYVLAEFNRTVVQDAVILHNIVASEPTVSEALIRLSALRRHDYTTASRCYLLLAMLEQRSGLSRDRLLATLAGALEAEFMKDFSAGIEMMTNQTDCALAKNRPVRKGNTYHLDLGCVREIERCDLIRFIESRRDELRAIRAALKEHGDDPILVRMADVLAVVAEDSSKALGRKNCWVLGDVFIALESPPEAYIYTSNVRHLEAIAAAIGKKVLPF